MEKLKPLKGHKSPYSHPNLLVTYKQSAAHTPYLTATGVFFIVSAVIQYLVPLNHSGVKSIHGATV